MSSSGRIGTMNLLPSDSLWVKANLVNILVAFAGKEVALQVPSRVHVNALLKAWMQKVELTDLLFPKISLTRTDRAISEKIININENDIFEIRLENVT